MTDRRRRARRRRKGPPPGVAPVTVQAPAGLQHGRLAVGGEEYLVLAFPIAPSHAEDDCNHFTLTLAERAVAAAAAAGRSNQAIAAERGVSARTVANQLASIYRKLGVASRAELAARWIRLPEAGE